MSFPRLSSSIHSSPLLHCYILCSLCVLILCSIWFSYTYTRFGSLLSSVLSPPPLIYSLVLCSQNISNIKRGNGENIIINLFAIRYKFLNNCSSSCYSSHSGDPVSSTKYNTLTIELSSEKTVKYRSK